VITLTSNERDLGLLLRQLRRAAGLSLVQLGERTNTTKGGISKREIHCRALTVGALVETAAALGYDLALVPRTAPRCQESTCPDYGDPDFGEGTCPAEHADPHPAAS